MAIQYVFLFWTGASLTRTAAAFHSRHHRLYVPYAYGALYNHPVEGFLLDTLGTGVAFLISGMTTRQSMWFFTCSTIKTVDDHCGYALPFDPLQHITSNNAGYHDIHHQSWGIKTNFSQPFFTFWDKIMGTMWVGGDISRRYERTKLAAQQKFAKSQYANSVSGSSPADSKSTQDLVPYEEPDHLLANDVFLLPPRAPSGKATAQIVESRQQVLGDKENGGTQVIAEEAAEEQRISSASTPVRRSGRRNMKNSVSSEVSLKGLKDRVSGSLPSGVPRMESRR
jgi:sphinganine C4-monooxygenase